MAIATTDLGVSRHSSLPSRPLHSRLMHAHPVQASRLRPPGAWPGCPLGSAWQAASGDTGQVAVRRCSLTLIARPGKTGARDGQEAGEGSRGADAARGPPAASCATSLREPSCPSPPATPSTSYKDVIDFFTSVGLSLVARRNWTGVHKNNLRADPRKSLLARFTLTLKASLTANVLTAPVRLAS